MKEKILNHKKNGFAMLFLIILLYAAGIGCVILGANMSDNGSCSPSARSRLYLDSHRLGSPHGTEGFEASGSACPHSIR